jgi:FkbM family methyltransferase
VGSGPWIGARRKRDATRLITKAYAMIADLFDINTIKDKPRHLAEAEIRARCATNYLGNHELLCRCLGYFKMFLDTRDVGFAPHVAMDGFWEYWITQFMIETIRPGFRVIDIGANFGYYTLLLSELIGPDGFCLAYEPNPEVARKLSKSVALNGFGSRTEVRVQALGKTAQGSVCFFVPADEPKNACVVPDDFRADAGAGDLIRVELTSLDAACANMDRLDFIKIDAEGSEYDIVMGMEQTLRRLAPALLIEVNIGRGYNGGRLLDMLSDIYGDLRFVDYDARLKPVDRSTVLTTNVGTDWMLYLAKEGQGV